MRINKEIALKIIFVISIFGVLFSGYLSYSELFSGSCPTGGCSNNKILNIPVCVYGLIMYLIIFVISLIGIRVKK